MSDALFNAIYARFIAQPVNAFHTAAGGRLAYGRAKEDWQDNYAVMYGPQISKKDLFRCRVDEVDIQFNLFAFHRADCWTLLNACVELYDGARLNIENHYAARLSRDLQVSPIWNEEDHLWQASCAFTALLQKA